mgnify:CR=1 FL=1
MYDIRIEAILSAILSVRMRPQTQTTTKELYECFKCGKRTESGGTCDCGGELQHIGRSRDL